MRHVYQIVDTVSGSVVAAYKSESDARRDQKPMNLRTDEQVPGAGYLLRYVVRRVSVSDGVPA
jgi:hypothetical protein